MISVAFVLSPSPIPLAIPTASAMTFFTAPPSSQPTTSGLVYGRKYGAWQEPCSSLAASSSGQATTEAACWRAAISPDRLGPEITATRSAGTPSTSVITWLIRLQLPSSMPFMRLTSSAPDGIRSAQSARFCRSDWAGTASTTRSAPARVPAGSPEACRASGSRMPGR